MTPWIAWSVLTSVLIAAAAVALERAVACVGKPRRVVWTVAMILATCVPLALALRVTPAARPAPSTTTVGVGSRRDLPPGLPVPTSHLERDGAIQPASPWRSAIVASQRIISGADAWIVRVWIMASTVLLLGLVRAILELHARRSRWKHANTEIGRVLVARDAGPAVIGFLRPRIVVPSWTLHADDQMRGLMLRHELEHVRAGDTRLLFAAELALVAFPWNAALWWMARKLRLAIEIDCDRRVIRGVGDERAHEYASMLIAVGERFAGGLPIAASLSEPGSNLEARIFAMSAPRRRPVIASLPFAAIALVVLTTAAWTPRPDPLRYARSVDPRPLRGNPSPKYPSALRDADIGGSVIRPANGSSEQSAASKPARVSGTVVDNGGHALKDAIVRLQDVPARFSVTNSSGEFALDGMPPGRHILAARRVGFAVARVQVALSETAPVVVTVTMNAAVRELPAMQVSPTMIVSLADVGYEQRRGAGTGFFMSGASLDTAAPAFSDVVRIAPGLRVRPIGSGRTNVIEDARRPTDGCVNVYVDGTLWHGMSPGDIDGNVRPSELVAIEVYRADETPAQFQPRGQKGCVAIVAWTARRVSR